MADLLIKPMEFAEAVAKVKNLLPTASALDTAGWARVPLAVRERAFFSARVESARVLSELQKRVLESSTKGEFVAKAREWLMKNGVAPATRQSDLRQLASTRRLELIFEHNTESARAYGWWKQGQDPDVLDAFPAQEFLRLEARQAERADWPERWRAAGGRTFGGRMIALKNDPVWARLSRFGTPWPPYDFGSGMGVEDVERGEAEALGLLQPDEPVTGDERDFNEAVEASARGLTPEARGWLERALGDVGRILGERVVMTPRPVAPPAARPPAQVLAEVLRADTAEEALKAIELPRGSRGKVGIMGEIPLPVKASVEDAAAVIERIVSAPILPRVAVKTKPRAGAYYTIDHTIHLAEKMQDHRMGLVGGQQVSLSAIHELMHDLEIRWPEIAKKTQAFLEMRAQRNLTKRGAPAKVKLSGGGKAWEDEWMAKGARSNYVGRIYPGYATEVLTEGTERLLQDPARFARLDPEFFKFIIEVLQP